MTDSRWKLSKDRHGVTTIVGDNFQLTTSSSKPMQMETVVSALQTLTRWTFGQYCSLARAMEMIGERWGILLVRDLMVGPRTVTQLREGFPQMPPGLLASRLAELERSGVIRVQVESGDDTRYELTEYGLALEVGEIVLHGRINDGALDIGKGSAVPDADLIIEPGTILKDLMTGVVTAEQALAHPSFQAFGNPALVGVFAKVFHLPSLPIQQRETR